MMTLLKTVKKFNTISVKRGQCIKEEASLCEIMFFLALNDIIWLEKMTTSSLI